MAPTNVPGSRPHVATLCASVRIPNPPSGGRTWWAHFEFTPINIELTILRKKIEEGALCAHFASMPE